MTKATKHNGSTATLERPQEGALARPAATVSERFLADVERQFLAEMGRGVQFTALERRLVQHMYLSVDQALKNAEARRKQGSEYTWNNIDRQKLAMDAVHRVALGLDALVPGHLWPIFYFNGKKGQYDVDLRIGYVGRDYVVRRFAVDQPVDITYELVHATDHFKALPKSSTREVEGYEFEITSPFDRGQVVGGFGYVVYDDPRKNRLILVTPRDFDRAQKAAKTSDFWTANDLEMRLKTIYHRVAGKIPLDPAKVINAAALAAVLDDDAGQVATAVAQVQSAARATANSEVLTIDAQPIQHHDSQATEPSYSPAGAVEPEGLPFDDEAPPF